MTLTLYTKYTLDIHSISYSFVRSPHKYNMYYYTKQENYWKIYVVLEVNFI